MFITATCIATLILYTKSLLNSENSIIPVILFLIIISSKTNNDFKRLNKVVMDNSKKINELERLIFDPDELQKAIIDHSNQIIELKNLIIDPKDYVLFSEKTAGSKFEFISMFKKAKKSLFIVGPNLAFLSEMDHLANMEALLFNKLRCDPEFKIRLLLLNPKNKDICKIMSKHAFTSKFLEELDRSLLVFSIWMKEANYSGLANLEIYVTDLITFSLTLIDSDSKEPDGCVLVSPILPKKGGGERPCFLVKKRCQSTAFDKYCISCRGLFKEAIPITNVFNDMPKDLRGRIVTKLNDEFKNLKENKIKLRAATPT